MNALKTSVCIAALLVWPVAPVQASIHGSNAGAPVGSCTYGIALPDGCPGAPANGNFQQTASYSTWARQSGQSWDVALGDHPQVWNVACVDYKCGYDTTLTLKDPTTFNWTGTGCSYASSKVTCFLNGKGVVKINGFEWGPTGGHGCIKLDILQTPTSLEISDNHFQRGAGCDGAYLITIESGTEPLLFTRNFIDGGYPTYNDITDFSMQDVRTGGSAVYTYNVWRNNSLKPLAGFWTGGLVYKYNYNDTFGLYADPVIANRAHIELAQGSGAPGATTPNFDWLYNTAVWPAASPGGGSAIIIVTIGSPASNPNTYTEVTMDHNTLIGNSYVAGGGIVNTSSIGFLSRAAHIVTWTQSNNYMDPTGAGNCGYLGGYTSNIVGFVDDGAGNGVNPGHIMTVNSQTNPVLVGSTFFINGNEAYTLVVQPYLSGGTTGTGSNAGGTYLMSGPTKNLTLSAALSTKGNLTPIIDTFVSSNNISLRTNTAITYSGLILNLGACGGSGHFP